MADSGASAKLHASREAKANLAANADVKPYLAASSLKIPATKGHKQVW
jgi:hypothetical protein